MRLAGLGVSWWFSAATSLGIAVVAYKDRCEIYLTRDFPLWPTEGAQVGEILNFVRGAA